MERMILAGDVGGTKTVLATFRYADGRLEVARETRLATSELDGLEGAIDEFLGSEADRVEAACFGVAGPVEDGIARLTNISWAATEPALGEHLGGKPVRLLNDLVAMGWGIATLKPDQLETLNEGRPDPQGNGALIAAGTGLGEAFLIRREDQWLPSPSEGGHTEFGPSDELEIDMLRYLNNRFGRVSYERLVSGPGLFNIYQFLRDTGRGRQPGWVADRLEKEDPSAVVGELAMRGADPLCRMALDRFVRLYGAEAGNLALTALATGGVYLGGGIAPKILDELKKGHFLEGFTQKGRMTGLMVRIPIKVILEPKTPLLGAAYFAARMCGG